MANVFISYARRDRERVAQLTSALEGEGLSVWWDPDLLPGRRYRQIIAEQLDGADSVIVVWTAASLESDWVQDEAEEGRQRGVLIPVVFEPVRPPAGFRQVQAADLSQWAGSAQHPEFRSLVFAIRSLVQIARATAKAAARSPGAVVEAAEPILEPDPPPAPTHTLPLAAEEPAPTALRTAQLTSRAVDSAPTAADPVHLPSPSQPTALRRTAGFLFGWLWWLGAAVAMLATITVIGMITNGGPLAVFYFLCAAPIFAAGVAMAARRAGVSDLSRATVAVIAGTVGALALVSIPWLMDSEGLAVRVLGGCYFGLLAMTATFAAAAGVALTLRQLRGPSTASGSLR